VVVNNPSNGFALDKSNKKILINVNSNHILARKRNFFITWLLKKVYNSYHTIICLNKTQVKPLRDFGYKGKIVQSIKLLSRKYTVIVVTHDLDIVYDLNARKVDLQDVQDNQGNQDVLDVKNNIHCFNFGSICRISI
jgi:hypothetical protein